MSADQLLKISELAEKARVMSSTIRHYSDLSLLPVAAYTDGGYRLYAEKECLERILKIQALSKRGLTLPEIKAEIEHTSKVKKILVVDDDPDALGSITDFLQFKFPQWQVHTAMDGFTAGSKLMEVLPDLLILDLKLPGVDGFQICLQIRKDPMLSGILVLAITGYDTEEVKHKILACGANDYLPKPMDLVLLEEKIMKLMKQKPSKLQTINP